MLVSNELGVRLDRVSRSVHHGSLANPGKKLLAQPSVPSPDQPLTRLSTFATRIASLAQAIHPRNVVVTAAYGSLVAGLSPAWSGWILALALAAVMTTARSVDYRRTPRAHAALPVRWRVAGIDGIGVLTDLSESGAALLLPRPVRAGDTVSFHVLWSRVSLRASGTVRRAQRTDSGTLVGLEWEEPTGSEALKLSRLAIDLTARYLCSTSITRPTA